MMKKLINSFLIFAVTAICVFAVASSSPKANAAGENDEWICAWGSAPAKVQIDGLGDMSSIIGSLIGDEGLTEVTIRSVITPSANGSKLRIKVSNKFNTKAVRIDGVTVAKSVKDSKIDLNTLKYVTFRDGYPGVTLAPGEELYSDPIRFDVIAHEKIAVTTYVKSFTDFNTMGLSGADTYIATGDAQREEDFDMLKNVIDDKKALDIIAGLLEGFGMGDSVNLKLAYSFIKIVPCVIGLDVLSSDGGYSVVVVGDSTVSNEFPLYLAQALYEDENITNVGVVGKGIPGNCLLYSGLGLGSYLYAESLLKRFNDDVLSQSGVKYVIVKIGVNDIIHPVCTDAAQNYPGVVQPSARVIINNYSKLFETCHKAGVKVIAIGITQWKGTTRDYFGDGGTYVRTSDEFEADWQIAKDVNQWLATTTEHDGYVDFCEISANPLDTDALLPEYSEDGIHPTDALQRVWGNSFPLSLIGAGTLPGGVHIKNNDGVVYVGKGKKFIADVYPETAENKEVTWTSEDPNIVVIDNSGVATGISNGITTLVCRTVEGGYKASCKVTVKTAAESIVLNYRTNSIYTSQSFTLKATIFPETTTDKAVTWSSEDKSIATVNKNGKVTGVGKGTTVINCTTADGAITASCTVTVNKKVHVENVELYCGDEANFTENTLYKGQSFDLIAAVSPSDATFKNVKWTSSNEKVATVDAEGHVVAVGGGKAAIKCTSEDNPMVAASCTVTVKVKATGITLSSTSLKLYVGKTKTLTANILPEDATNKSVTWKSLDSKIAKVDKNGKITAVKAGTTYITATTANGKYTAKCKVTVANIVKSKSVKLNKTSVTINDGKTYKLTETIAPSNTTDKTVTWSVSDKKIIKVSADGKVTALKPGTAYVYCKTKDTGKTAKCKVTVKAVVPTSVKFSSESVSVAYGKTKTLKATVSPSNSTDKTLKWSSSDPSIVSVTQSGKIKGLKAGKSATITVTTNSGKRKAQITVKVTHVKPTAVSLNKANVTLSKGNTVTLTPKFAPSNTSVKTVTWSSDNKSVATVSSKGVVKAVSNGTAVITCTTKNGLTAVCVVTVAVIPVTSVSIKESGGLLMNVGSTYNLHATVYPTTATNKKVTWSSSNPNVATVSSSGKVTAKGRGNCVISVTTADGNKTAKCNIVVS